MKRPLPISVAASEQGRVSDQGDLDGLLAQVHRTIKSIHQRMAGLEKKTMPAVYGRDFVFQPEVGSFLLDTQQDGVSSNLVNYVVRSGVDYNVNVLVGGDGVFRCHGVRVQMYQRLYVASSNIRQWAMVPMSPLVLSPVGELGQAPQWSTKFSLWPKQPAARAANASPPDGDPMGPACNFRWNIQDPISGVQYADRHLPLAALYQRTFMLQGPQDFGPDGTAVFPDGAWHRFSSSWDFAEAQNLLFIFRPVTDVYQFDSSISGTNPQIGLPYDDRINLRRSQPVILRVEFFGERIGGRND